MQVIGVDCAVRDKLVGMARGLWDGEHLRIVEALPGGKPGSVQQTLARWIDDDPLALLAFDAPLGWPQPLGQVLSGHKAGEPVCRSAHDLFRRETDRFIRQRHHKQPLDVGADRIARTAVAALSLLEQLRKTTGEAIPLAWDRRLSHSAVVEVYPGATLRALGAWRSGYRQRCGDEQRRSMVDHLSKHLCFEVDKGLLVESVDVLDAVVCVLAGIDFLTGRAEGPTNKDLALIEGWTWVRPPSGA